MQLPLQKFTSTTLPARSPESASGRETFSHASAAPNSGACTPLARWTSMTWRARSRREACDRMEDALRRTSERRQGGGGVRPLQDRPQLGAVARREGRQPADDQPEGAVGLERGPREEAGMVEEGGGRREGDQGLDG